MNISRVCTTEIGTVVVYTGHRRAPVLGPYAGNVARRIQMFKDLNLYRSELGKRNWTVKTISGEELEGALKKEEPTSTLLVIPAGQSSNLEKVFSVSQTTFLRKEFFNLGGRGYFTCGASYWVSRVRKYNEICKGHLVEKPAKLVKQSTLPLFEGLSIGPLCPFPGGKYRVGFYSDAVEVTDGRSFCSIYLSGGGSFLPDLSSNQRVKVLVKYTESELIRLGVPKENIPKRENAAVMASVGKGAVLLSMFHPYYSSNDIDVELYERIFSGCGTNWREVHQKLSPVDVRMRFILHSMLNHLEEMQF